MRKPRIFAHCSYLGQTGYNNHTRDFFRALSKLVKIKVRTFTVGENWKGNNLTPHEYEPYITDLDRSLLYQQILWNSDGSLGDYPIYPSPEKEFIQDLNIVLCETNHHIFYQDYNGPKIAYNFWDTTLQPEQFFNKLLEFDEMWVPTNWQRDNTILQGYDPEKIKVVPSGVDTNIFFPDLDLTHELTSNGKFNFFMAGSWDYRKSTKEIIETFIKTFDKNEPVNLIISVDNRFSFDNLNSTEERLKHHNLVDDRITTVHFLSRDQYIKLIKTSDCFLSCSRCEGWNLPLIEAMASGTPAIYSNCSGQLEFAQNKGIPVNILGTKPASNQNTYNHVTFGEISGDYYEPDFNDLSDKMRYVYENHKKEKERALNDCKDIHEKYSWNTAALIGFNRILDFMKKSPTIM
jgi:glycosyltransferase involved in cell wall biosynthesis